MGSDFLFKTKDVESTFLVKRLKQFRVLTGVFSKVEQPIIQKVGPPVYIFLVSNSAMLTVAMILGSDSFNGFCARVGNFASFLTVAGMTLFYNLREEKISSLSYELAEKWVEFRRKIHHTRGVKTIALCEKKMKFIFYLLIYTSICVILVYSSHPILRYFLFPFEGQKRLTFPLTLYVPFESPLIRAYVYIMTCVCIGHVALLLSIISTMYLCIFCMLEASFQLNGSFYERFSKDKTDEADEQPTKKVAVYKRDVIRKWNLARHAMSINEHQALYRMAECLKSLIRETVLIMYSGAIVAVAFSSVLVITDPKHYGHSVLIMIVPSVHMFTFFFMASRVTIVCEETATILYQHHMDLLTAGSDINAHAFLIMLMRAQKPVTFEAGRFRKLTLENYVSYMQNIYSFMMLLHSMKRGDATP